MNPLEIVETAYHDHYYNHPSVMPDMGSVVVMVSQELKDRCLEYVGKEWGHFLKYDPSYKSKTGLILAGKDCAVDPTLKGLAAYTRY